MNRVVLLAALASCLAGCGAELPRAADPARARASLQLALSAWQNGESWEALPKRSPPVYFNDEEWRSGQQLVDYEIESEATNGQGWLCQARLKLRSKSGSPIERRVRYLIDTDPAIVIVQQP